MNWHLCHATYITSHTYIRTVIWPCCRSVVPVGQLELLPGCTGVPESLSADMTASLGPRYMALDGAALESLEVSVQLDFGHDWSSASSLLNIATL